MTAAALLAVTAPAHAVGGGGWAVFPTPPAGTQTPGPADRQYFYLESAPGRTLTDHVSVVNLGARPETFRLHATDPWVKLSSTGLTVPPHTRADVPFSLAIPTTAEPGDHQGSIVAEDAGSRPVGVRIYLHVTGQPVPAFSVDDVSVRRSVPAVPGLGTNRATLQYTLTNHGNVTLHPSVEVTETGWFGSVYHRPLSSAGIELPPGRSVRLNLALPGPPLLDDVAVTVKASDGATGAQGQTGYLAIPWLVLVFVVLLLAVLGVWLWLRSKRSHVHRAGWWRSRESVGVAA
ncbi:DUF916 domain-containing protein [Streptacidiphilus pinicola]|uniref:DUF916 domain-containing protein n=1 Tax=Streptacidiphilus pinicola TaxID=2219663 RepID=A0A2X0IS88_9ACTN|nr:DUF916 domain-containing protein [Streptacidiphilus pinicola]